LEEGHTVQYSMGAEAELAPSAAAQAAQASAEAPGQQSRDQGWARAQPRRKGEDEEVSVISVVIVVGVGSVESVTSVTSVVRVDPLCFGPLN